MQENLSSGPRVRTAKVLTCAGRSAPLLFAFWKASYLNLLQEKLVTVAEQAILNLNKTLFVAYISYYYIRLFMNTHIHSGK